MSVGDQIITTLSFLGLGMPGFLLALLILYFAITVLNVEATGLFSPDYVNAAWSWDRFVDLLKHPVWIPAIISAVTGVGGLTRIMRGNLLETLGQPFVEAARARGLTNGTVIWKHAVRIAINPLIVILGWEAIPGIITGSGLVAVVLNLPTIFPLYIDSLRKLDMYMAGTCIVLLTLLTLIGNLLADITLAWADPRIRLETEKGKQKVNYRYLGRTGLKVSELCLGAMTFGRESTEEVSFQMLDRFAAAGGNFIDTANVYSQGISEEILGRWLHNRRRADFVFATKVRFAMGPGPNDTCLSRKHILASVEESLRRLQTTYIDLYQVHAWDPGTPLEETLDALDRLVESGKVRYLGASNFAGYQLQKAIDLSRQNGWDAFACLQPLYNLLDRSFEWELMPVCEAEGVGVIPWSSLRGGWLSGKYHRGPLPQIQSRREHVEGADDHAEHIGRALR